jgi:hypothetical protein
MTILTLVEVTAPRDHNNKQELPMSIRSSFLAVAATAAVTASWLTPASAAAFGPRHFAHTSYHFAYTKPGVSLCKRGIIYVCQ